MKRIVFLSLLCISAKVFAQSTDKKLLLQNVTRLPLPDSPQLVAASYIISEEPQIVATGFVEQGKSYQLNAIVTSRFGKGKVIVFGSSEYFKKPLLDNSNVQQLLVNSFSWATKGKKIALEQSDASLAKFVKAHNYSVTQWKNGGKNNADILILTSDVKDSAQSDIIETFVKNGGTLIFGSPLSDIFSKQKDSDPFYQLKLNAFLTKAGIFHVYNPLLPSANNHLLVIDTIPRYLHISTLLSSVKDGGFKQWEKGKEFEIADASLKLAIAYNNENSGTVTDIKNAFGLRENDLLVPTPAEPIRKKDFKKYLQYIIQQVQIEKRRDANPDSVYVAKASYVFPGYVGSDVRRVNKKVTLKVQGGSQGLWDPTSVFERWHSTGLYVPAGEKVYVTVDAKDTALHLKAQIGVHDDNLMHMDVLTREGIDLTKKIDLKDGRNAIFSEYGGLLLITIPDTAAQKYISVNVEGAVQAPYFKLGETSVEEWKKTIRNYSAPWAELATDKIIFSLPSSRIRDLDDPEKLMRFWDEVMDADANLACISVNRLHPERIIVDQEVAWGYMFTQYYKIVVPDDESCKWSVDEAFMRDKGSWGHFHELGHRHQFWGIDFDALGEVTENLYSMYVYDKVLHKGIYNHEAIASKEAVHKRIKDYMASGPSYEKWSDDAFLALCMYIELIENFGWDAIIKVHKVYRALPKDQYPKTEQDKRDYWFLQISNATQKNLSSFFDKWKVPVSDSAKKQVESYPTWLPEELTGN